MKRAKFNVVDLLILILIAGLIVSAVFRENITRLFSPASDTEITYQFKIEAVEGRYKNGIKIGDKAVLTKDGSDMGEVAQVGNPTESKHDEILVDGEVYSATLVDRYDITGTVIGRGYVSEEGCYLNNGALIVPGNRFELVINHTVYQAEITAVSAE